MAIDLREFASGDTDYIAKMNANVSDIENAINALQAQAAAAGPGTAIAAGLFMVALFNDADCLIGPDSYFVTQHATTLTVDPGAMYIASTGVVVRLYTQTSINMAGQTAGQKYIVVDAAGTPLLNTSQLPGTVYSVYWNGSAFIGQPVRICPVFYDAAESTASRESTILGLDESPPETMSYHTLDDRLEATEEMSLQASQDAANALALAYELGGAAVKIRKVGCSVDGTTGVKGTIQIDFAGTIIGWSVIADGVGTLQVEVDRKASSAPPAVPAIPNTTTDKISASAPIALASAQSAARAAAGVASWSTTLAQWDVLQFNVVAVTGVTRATLYLRIEET